MIYATRLKSCKDKKIRVWGELSVPFHLCKYFQKKSNHCKRENVGFTFCIILQTFTYFVEKLRTVPLCSYMLSRHCVFLHSVYSLYSLLKLTLSYINLSFCKIRLFQVLITFLSFKLDVAQQFPPLWWIIITFFWKRPWINL